MCFTWVDSGLTHKHQTRLERLAKDKRSRLFWKVITNGRKMFQNIGSWSHCCCGMISQSVCLLQVFMSSPICVVRTGSFELEKRQTLQLISSLQQGQPKSFLTVRLESKTVSRAISSENVLLKPGQNFIENFFLRHPHSRLISQRFFLQENLYLSSVGPML